MKAIDLADIAVIVGVLLIGLAVFWAWAAPGVVGYAGVVLVAMGMAAAYKRGQVHGAKD